MRLHRALRTDGLPAVGLRESATASSQDRDVHEGLVAAVRLLYQLKYGDGPPLRLGRAAMLRYTASLCTVER